MLLKIGKKIDKATAIMSIVSYVCISAIVLMVVVDVFLNKAFQKPILGSYELTEQMLLCAVFASFAYAQSNHSHINMALVISHLPRTLRFVCFSIMCALSSGMAVLVGYCAVVQGLKNLATHVTTATLFIPLFPFTFLVALSMFVFAIAMLYDMVLSFAAIKNDECAEIVTSGWST